MGKTRKAFSERFKITKRNKILRRVAGQAHSFAKKTSRSLKRKKKEVLTNKLVLKYQTYQQ